jgi:peptide/nickel transport system substrate-binding protein
LKTLTALVYASLVIFIFLAGCVGTEATQALPAATEETTVTEPPATPETEPPLAEPATLRIGWQGLPDTLNPAYAFLTESYSIFDLVYSTLVTESPTGEYIGELAQEWSVSEDGTVWTFKLKDGIKWHTGEDFKAEDMVWAIQAIMDNPDGWATSSNYTTGFKEVTAPDSKTVQITLDGPVSNMEYRVSFLYATYPKDFQPYTTPEDLQNFPNDMPIGTGAFKMNTFDKDRGVIILDAFEDYHGTVPKIDQVVFQTFDNADAMIQALKVGDVEAVREVPNSAFETVRNLAGVKAVEQPGRGLAELIINSAPADNDPPPNRNLALDDPQVRLAIATAINKQDILDIVLLGLGETATTIIPRTLGGGFWHNPLTDVTFNLDEAARILDEAGYVVGSDGVRAKGDIRLDFRLQYPSDSSNYPRTADLISGWLREINVKTTPESVDPDSLTAAMTPTGDYDLVIWGWTSDPDPDFMLSVMTSDQFVEGGWSDSGYSNPEYDQLYLDQQVVVNKDERQEIVWRMQEMVYNDRPYVVLYYEPTLDAYRSDRFSGFIESPLGIIISQSLQQVEPVQ